MKLWLSVRNWVIKPKHRTNQIGVQGTSSLVRPGETWSSPQARNSPFETQCPPWVSTKTNKKERPTDWLVFPENCATCGSRFFCSFLVDFRKSENQKGIPRSAERVSGLCPENPQPLKRLAKLSLRLRAGWVRPLFLNFMRSSLIIQFLSNRREHILCHGKILSASMLINRDR